ncbi:MAG: hypothetical protein Q9160_008531 [Pyrenula sp. 1 TL-2023]
MRPGHDAEFIITEPSGYTIWGASRNHQDLPCCMFLLQAPDGRFARGWLYATEGSVAAGNQYRLGYSRVAQIPHMQKQILDIVARLPRVDILSPATEGRWELKAVQGRPAEQILICEQNIVGDDGEDEGSVTGPLLLQSNDWRLDFERGLLQDIPPFSLTWSNAYLPFLAQETATSSHPGHQSGPAETGPDEATDAEGTNGEEDPDRDLLEFEDGDDPEDDDYQDGEESEDDYDP